MYTVCILLSSLNDTGEPFSHSRPLFLEAKFQAALGLQLVQMESSEETLTGLWPLPSAISQLSGGHPGCSACSAEGLERTLPFTSQPKRGSSGVQAPWTSRVLCPFLRVSVSVASNAFSVCLFSPIFEPLTLTSQTWSIFTRTREWSSLLDHLELS